MGFSRLQKEEMAKMGTYYSVLIGEDLRFWQKKFPWEADYFKKHKLGLGGFSAKGTISIGEEDKIKYTKRVPLFLPCGITIQNGYAGSTSQSRVVSINSVRVDSVFELNKVFADLSNMFGIDVWTITSLKIHNTKIGAILFFELFNPDSTGTNLYLSHIEQNHKKEEFYKFNYMEQTKYCEHLYDRVAVCEMVDTKKPMCHLKRLQDIKRGK